MSSNKFLLCYKLWTYLLPYWCTLDRHALQARDDKDIVFVIVS